MISTEFVQNSLLGNNRRAIDDQLFVHFVTFSIFRRRRLLNHDHAKRILLGWLNVVLEQDQARYVGFVIMPEHIHALVWLPGIARLHPTIQPPPRGRPLLAAQKLCV